MIKVLFLDCDGPVIKREKYFSQRFSEEFGVPLEKIMEFIKGRFVLCETGQADLKQELGKLLGEWRWKGSVDDLLEFWFSGERKADSKMLGYVKEVRSRGVKVYITTNNEKYRTADIAKTVGLKNCVDGIFSSAGVGFLKPDPKFWETVLKSLPEVSKGEVLVWDDKKKNVDSAKTFGFSAELYSNFEDYLQKMQKYLG